MKIRPFRFRGATAVVTGAAGGIGEQLACGLARRGSQLILVDCDAGRLAAVGSALQNGHPDLAVRTFVADLADEAAVVQLAEDILAAAPSISLLINNAGVALAGHFDQVSTSEFDWVMNVNFRAPVLLTRHLLPGIAPDGHIVNVSSLFGLVAPTGQTAYAASKFALRGFTEALRNELLPRGIGVTSVHPGGVRTDIARNARIAGRAGDDVRRAREDFDRLLTFPAGRAAELMLKSVRTRRPRLLIGMSAKIPDLITRLAPTSFGVLERGAVRGAGAFGRALRR